MASSTRVPLYTDDDGTPPAAPKARRGGSWRDMVYSMAVLLVPVLIGLGVWHFLTSDKQVNTVDPASAVTQARQADRFPVVTPHGLTGDWRATSAQTTAKHTQVTLRIGYVTPTGGFAQLVESNEDSATLLADAVPQGSRPSGAEHLGGADWARYTGDKDHEVLALLEPHRTILVVGQTDESELLDLARSLR